MPSIQAEVVSNGIFFFFCFLFVNLSMKNALFLFSISFPEWSFIELVPIGAVYQFCNAMGTGEKRKAKENGEKIGSQFHPIGQLIKVQIIFFQHRIFNISS